MEQTEPYYGCPHFKKQLIEKRLSELRNENRNKGADGSIDDTHTDLFNGLANSVLLVLCV